MTDEAVRSRRFAKWVLILPVVLAVVLYAANVITRQRVVMVATGTAPFSSVSGITDSPSGRHVVAVHSSGLQGITHTVKVASRFSVWPTRVMSAASEDFRGKGPYGSHLALVWGSGDRCVGLVFHGWLVDFYDFETQSGDSWANGLYDHTDQTALAAYHQKIEALFGSDRQTQTIR